MTTVTRTHDEFLVYRVMTNPALWETCAEDGQEPESWAPNMDEWWMVVTHGADVAGLYNMHEVNSATLEIHAQILPEFRDCAKESARKVLQWVLDYSPDKYQKLIATIPVIYPNVIKFTENAGFQREGVNRLSYRKHGELHDQVMLGITRDEIGSFLRGLQ